MIHTAEEYERLALKACDFTFTDQAPKQQVKVDTYISLCKVALDHESRNPLAWIAVTTRCPVIDMDVVGQWSNGEIAKAHFFQGYFNSLENSNVPDKWYRDNREINAPERWLPSSCTDIKLDA